jgi:endo-1,4-beta-xylanase
MGDNSTASDQARRPAHRIRRLVVAAALGVLGTAATMALPAPAGAAATTLGAAAAQSGRYFGAAVSPHGTGNSTPSPPRTK